MVKAFLSFWIILIERIFKQHFPNGDGIILLLGALVKSKFDRYPAQNNFNDNLMLVPKGPYTIIFLSILHSWMMDSISQQSKHIGFHDFRDQ